MKKEVIVLCRNYYSALGAARSLGEAGFEVSVLTTNRMTQKVADRSKYVTRCIRTALQYDAIHQGLEQLRGKKDKILIIPLHDRSLVMLDEHAEQLRDHYYIPHINGQQGKIAQFMNKMIQKETAQQCGIKTSDGIVCVTEEDKAEEAAAAMKRYPCFIKPLASYQSNAAKNIFAKCDNREELIQVLQNARKQNCDKVLAEDYLPIEKELSAYGFAEKGTVILAARMDMIRSGYGRHQGVAAEGIISDSESFGELKNKLIAFVKQSRLSGLFCIDLIQSGGEIYFTEMNLRCGATGYEVTKAGYNLYAEYARAVYGESSDRSRGKITETHFICDHIEYDAYVDGFISYRQMREDLKTGAEKFVKSKADPVPGIIVQMTLIKQTVKQKLLHNQSGDRNGRNHIQ